MKVKLGLLLLGLLPVAAFAQAGVAGKWTGELSAADGHGIAQPITIELKLDGQALSGTVTEGALDARPIQGAAMEGTTVTFRTVRNLGGSDINVNWKGEVKGDDLTLSREIGPAPAEPAAGRGGGGGRGGRGGAAGAAPAAAPIPQAPGAAPAAAAGGRGAGGGAAGGAAGGGGAAAGGRGGAGGGGGRGGAAPAVPAGPTVALTLHRAR